MHVVSSRGDSTRAVPLLRGYRSGSWRTVLAGWLVATWQLALGFTLGLMLAYLLACLGVVVLLYWRRQRPSRHVVAATGAGAAMFLCVGVLLALPYQQVKEDHPESKRTPATVAAFSGGLDQFAAAPEQNLIWGPVTEEVREDLGFIPEQTMFPGLVVLLLAALGLSRWSPFPKRLRIGLGAGVVLLGLLCLGFRVPGDGFPYPYRALYEWAPGWDAVRTPGRLNTLLSLDLALLAAAGASSLLAVVRQQLGGTAALGRVLAVGLPALILLEGAGFPYPHPTVAKPPAGLAEATAPRLHLPMYEYESRRFLLWSTNGFPEIVNGRGSFKPESFDELEALMASFPDRRMLRLLREMGVETVVLHPDIVAGTPWEGWRDWPLEGEETGGVVLYRLDTGS